MKARDLSAIQVPSKGVVKVITVNNRPQLSNIPYKNTFVIGEGTNTYFGEALNKITLVKLKMNKVSFKDTIVKAEASVNWDSLVKRAVAKDLWGIENLSFIPGSVGATPVQNIGAYGAELKDCLKEVEVFDRKEDKIKILNNSDCKFGYRDSIFKQQKNRYIILSVTLSLSKKPKRNLSYSPLNTLPKDCSIKEVRSLVVKTRKDKLPDYKKLPNCGSFFKNPIISRKTKDKLLKKYPSLPVFEFKNQYKTSAAYLIDRVAGLKGYKYKNFVCYERQPLVIVNLGKSTTKDLEDFIKIIKTKVKKLTGITLEQEVNKIGK
jgi:UDP-N-acetylmuramate dehydrogenase